MAALVPVPLAEQAAEPTAPQMAPTPTVVAIAAAAPTPATSMADRPLAGRWTPPLMAMLAATVPAAMPPVAPQSLATATVVLVPVEMARVAQSLAARPM